MPIVVKQSENTFESIDEGKHQAICDGVFDLGCQKISFNGNEKEIHQIAIVFEVDQRFKKGDFSGKRMRISKDYTMSLDKRASLKRDLETWRGKIFTEEELKGFDVEKLVGVNAYITIQSDNSGFPKITMIEKIGSLVEPLKAEYNKSTPPIWVKNKIEKGDFSVKEESHSQQKNNDEDIPF